MVSGTSPSGLTLNPKLPLTTSSVCECQKKAMPLIKTNNVVGFSIFYFKSFWFFGGRKPVPLKSLYIALLWYWLLTKVVLGVVHLTWVKVLVFSPLFYWQASRTHKYQMLQQKGATLKQVLALSGSFKCAQIICYSFCQTFMASRNASVNVSWLLRHSLTPYICSRAASSQTEISPIKKPQRFALLRARDGTWAQPVLWEGRRHVQSSMEASGCIHWAGGPGDSL